MRDYNDISKLKMKTCFARLGHVLVLFAEIEVLIEEIISRYYAKDEKISEFYENILFHRSIAFEMKKELLEKIYINNFEDQFFKQTRISLMKKITYIQGIRNKVSHCGMLEVKATDEDQTAPFVALKKKRLAEVLDSRCYFSFQQKCADIYSILIKLGKRVGMNINYVRPEFAEMVSPKVKIED